MTAATVEAAAPARRPVRPPLHRLAWATWRQHRTALLVIAAALACCAAILFVEGSRMHADFVHDGLNSCLPGHPGRDCGVKLKEFQADQNRVNQLMAFFLPLPLLFGLFLGAPLVAREYESGTYRFAFTQGVDRTRWLTVKIALLALFTLVTATAFTLVVMWWYAPLVPLNGRLDGGGIQEIYGLVFVARALFALALGICSGAALRRVVPAIGATLVVWVVVVVTFIVGLRPHLIPPVTLVNPTDHVGLQSGDPAGWLLSDVWRAPNGSVLSYQQLQDAQYQAALAGHKLDFTRYLGGKGYVHTVRFDPPNRFWDFQAVEAGVLTVLALGLLVAAVWLVRRRAA